MSAAHLAAAGGGSFGFHGGGGGGGHGGGAGLYILIQILVRVALLGHGLGLAVLVGIVLLWVLFARVGPVAGGMAAARRRRGRAARRAVAKRERRVELAAAEAAVDDPMFAPDTVRTQATELFRAIQSAWDGADRQRLRDLLGAELLREWDRRLDDLAARGWRNHVEVLEGPRVEYVGLEHRGGEDDRVTVRIEAQLRDYVLDRQGRHVKRKGSLGETVATREYWTLKKGKSGHWILESIEQGAEGAHVLGEAIVATPWSDDVTMRDEALVEQAAQDAVPAGTDIAELADLDFTGDARAAALDLSLADGRFSPDVLEVAARRAVQAWARAIDGEDRALRGLARPEAVRELLHPGDPSERTRVVVRGPRVKQIRITRLDAAARPPTMSVEVDLEGRRYLEDRDTTQVVAGDQDSVSSFTEHWTLALDGEEAQPWRIAAVVSPVTRI